MACWFLQIQLLECMSVSEWADEKVNVGLDNREREPGKVLGVALFAILTLGLNWAPVAV